MDAAPRDFGHIRALDGIRGFAVILVLGYHSLYNALQPASPAMSFLQTASMSGWIGVDFSSCYQAFSLRRFGYTALVFGFSSLIALALFPGGWTSRIFSNAALRAMGKYSYSSICFISVCCGLRAGAERLCSLTACQAPPAASGVFDERDHDDFGVRRVPYSSRSERSLVELL